ncbi:hypothetical protein DDE82_004535 [Stemphylium lycopersici]|uniref:Uncharacterized protein n=1 Tax=Stemphylium lycopersici TaxID=183478 RepID=A0A364MRL5_STELY|nr:hypothetical protein DDE83_009094 [Stemphylium lycopersici]RAR04331.1 hypothetical protein DDE82_004535 [Stemphylium lycopersici]
MSDAIKAMAGESKGKGHNQISLSLILKDTQGTSPISTSSDDTLHDDQSSDFRSHGDDATTFNSPVSPEGFNFKSLTIVDDDDDDDDPRFSKGGGDRYNHHLQRGRKHHADAGLYGFPGRDFRGNNRSGAPYSGRGGTGAFRNSRTWMSADAQRQQEFLIVRNAMRRLFKHSDIAKWKLGDYVAHREAMLASQASKLARQVTHKEKARHMALSVPPETETFLRRCGLDGNYKQVGNSGRVLGEQTIWCQDWENGKDEVAPWPSAAEMKWEGDDRAKTGVGRFLPLPREDGPPGLMWNQLPAIEQYPIDQVCKIPTMEDVYLPVDYHIEPDHEYLWSKALEQEMDALLEA